MHIHYLMRTVGQICYNFSKAQLYSYSILQLFISGTSSSVRAGVYRMNGMANISQHIVCLHQCVQLLKIPAAICVSLFRMTVAQRHYSKLNKNMTLPMPFLNFKVQQNLIDIKFTDILFCNFVCSLLQNTVLGFSSYCLEVSKILLFGEVLHLCTSHHVCFSHPFQIHNIKMVRFIATRIFLSFRKKNKQPIQ